MTKEELNEKLQYVATNAPHRVHELLAFVQDAKSEDAEVQNRINGLNKIKVSGRTDLSVWTEIMDNHYAPAAL